MESAESVTSIFNSIAIFMQSGGVFMWFIFIIWGFGIAVAIERFFKLTRKFDVDGPTFMNEIQRYVLAKDIQGAIRICSNTTAVLARVLKSGLKRASHGETGIQNAVDATALEVIPKVEKRLGFLQLVANISTLLGLLGTIQGLIQSFSAVSAADPAQKSEVLAKGISVAMNTTFLGLLAAITVMVMHSYLSSRAEKIVGEVDEYSVKLIDLLTTKKVEE